MARIFSIVSFLILVAVPAAGAMGHAHHAGHGDEPAAVPTQEGSQPLALACDVAESAEESMPGHGACLGCCPDRYVQGNVSPTPRVQDALALPESDVAPSTGFDRSPFAPGARSHGLVRGDFSPILRL